MLREKIRNFFNPQCWQLNWRSIWLVMPLGLLLLAVYYGGGMALVHRINDDLDYTMAEPAAGSSRAVAMAATLIHREVDENYWTANDPWFLPGAALDNMPNFQQGIIYALGRFAVQLSDQLGRARGSSQVDPDLNLAAGFLRYSGTIWIINPKSSLGIGASSESQYRQAETALNGYNKRVAAGTAVYDRRADNLIATLDSIAADLGSQSAILDEQVRAYSFLGLDFKSDDVYYGTKGRLYAYYLLLRELGRDYEQIIANREVTPVWEAMIASFREAAGLQPLVVLNAVPDSLLIPSHLAAQGFYLLRARTQLREITNILVK
jgi:hypothetical protein